MSRGVEQEPDQVTGGCMGRVDHTYSRLMERADRIHDPLLRGAVEVAIIVPALGYLVARETIEDIAEVTRRNN